ncbi:MAG: ABC transporter substrate-binding protein [Bacteroidota bacterium]
MLRTISIIIAVFLFLSGCKSENKKEQTVSETNLMDYGQVFEYQVTPKYAKKFTVNYHDNYKVVRTNATLFDNNSEDATSSDIEDVLVLVQKGTTPPELKGPLKGASIIEIPVESAAVNVQHSESFLREIGLENRINAIGGLYSYNDEMREKALTGAIGQIGYSWHSPPNFEVLLQRKPDVFLMTLASLSHKESLDMGRQFGIPTVPVFDWAEHDYLARAEWVKFYSLFFNAEKEANEVFNTIENKVESLKRLTQNIATKESALWGYYGSKQRWIMQINSIPAQYLADAGIENVLAKNTKANADGSQALNTEELLLKGKGAQHWVIGDIHAAPLPQENIMNHFDSWRTGKLYHNLKRVKPKVNTSDWYAKAIVRPDMVLEDLIRLAYPQLLPDHTPVFMGYYDKVSEGPVEQQG